VRGNLSRGFGAGGFEKVFADGFSNLKAAVILAGWQLETEHGDRTAVPRKEEAKFVQLERLGRNQGGRGNEGPRSHGTTTNRAKEKQRARLGWSLKRLGSGAVFCRDIWKQMTQLEAQRRESFSGTGAEQAIIADFHEGFREHVLEEAANELFRRQRAAPLLACIRAPIAKGNLIVFHLQDPVVADGHPKNVGCQVFQRPQARSHRFTMHHPVLFPNPGGNEGIDRFLAQRLV
jgi:hypothetical protein